MWGLGTKRQGGNQLNSYLKLRCRSVLIGFCIMGSLFLFGVSHSVNASDAQAVFRISDKAALNDPGRFGTNYPSYEIKPWNGFVPQNQWIGQGQMETVDFFHIGYASGGGENYIEDKWIQGRRAGAGFWKIYLNGFWDNATVCIYRHENNQVRFLRRDTVKTFHGDTDSDERIILETSGKPIKEGDIYALTLTKPEVDRYRLQGRYTPVWEKAGAKLKTFDYRLDTDEFAPDGHSRASLRVTFSEDVYKGCGIAQKFQGDRDGWLSFDPGKRYIFRGWFKKQGMRTGLIRIYVERNELNYFDRTFNVSEQWQPIEFEFQGDIPQRPLTYFKIFAFEKGTLWVDSLQIFEKGVPPNDPKPEVTEALKRFKPSVIRFWSGLFEERMENWLRLPMEKHLQFEKRNRDRSHPSLPMIFRICEQAGANPWLITRPLMSPDDIHMLMEYIGGNPETRFGALRAGHGRKTPWTDAFEKIYIEVGNEMWNQLFVSRSFSGRPQLAGAIAEYAFQEIKSSPYYDADRFEFIVGGWKIDPSSTGWGYRVVENAPSAEYLGLTAYVEGWNGVHIPEVDDAAIFPNYLMYSPRVIEPRNLAHLKTFREAGLPIRFSTYEGGPSYELPNPTTPWREETEYIGKSIASGIATLDAFMFNLQLGFTPQCFFMFGGGNNWASHTMLPDFRPHPHWLALEMRNNLLKGRLLTVTPEKVPTVDLEPVSMKNVDYLGTKRQGKTVYKTQTLPGKKAVPEILCYAFQDDRCYSVMVLSRRAKADTLVELIYPDELEQNGKIYYLHGRDPSSSNRKHMEVMVHEISVNDISQRYEMVIPPHSATVIVSYKK